jgi:hypothetical protein
LITLKNSAGTLIKTKNSISGKILSITPTSQLATDVKYNLIMNAGSVQDLSGHNNSYYSTCFTVSPITLAQIKDGFSRAQTFVNINLRLPNYVSYGTKTIGITEFQKILATQGLKINTKIQDLIVTNVTAPIKGFKGNTIIVSNTIKNRGNTATNGFWVSYYLKLSSNNINNYVGHIYISSLTAGASNSQNTQLTIPVNITSSNYYIMAYVDSTNLVNESNETNNYGYSPRKIQIIDYTPIYITSDNIDYPSKDIVRINNIVAGLKAMGLYAVNYGVGSNEHSDIVWSPTMVIPANALIVNIYGGVCAGTIWEMCQNGTNFKKALGSRKIFSIWINTPVNITNMIFLQRSHDDNFTALYDTPLGFPNFLDTNSDGIFEPGVGYNSTTKMIYPNNFTEEDGISNPALLLTANGYDYLYHQDKNDVTYLINAIYHEAVLM